MSVAVLRLPPTSRLRRELFARSIRDNAEAFARRDYDAFLIGLDPQVVLDTGDAFPETNLYHGVEGMRRFLALIDGVWREYRIEPEVIVDFGEGYVLFARHRARGSSSGLEVDHRVGLVGTFRDGQVVRLEFHWVAENALEAAGLSE